MPQMRFARRPVPLMIRTLRPCCVPTVMLSAVSAIGVRGSRRRLAPDHDVSTLCKRRKAGQWGLRRRTGQSTCRWCCSGSATSCLAACQCRPLDWRAQTMVTTRFAHALTVQPAPVHVNDSVVTEVRNPSQEPAIRMRFVLSRIAAMAGSGIGIWLCVAEASPLVSSDARRRAGGPAVVVRSRRSVGDPHVVGDVRSVPDRRGDYQRVCAATRRDVHAGHGRHGKQRVGVFPTEPYPVAPATGEDAACAQRHATGQDLGRCQCEKELIGGKHQKRAVRFVLVLPRLRCRPRWRRSRARPAGRRRCRRQDPIRGPPGRVRRGVGSPGVCRSATPGSCLGRRRPSTLRPGATAGRSSPSPSSSPVARRDDAEQLIGDVHPVHVSMTMWP